MRFGWVPILGWFAAAAAATAVGLFAVALIQHGLVDGSTTPLARSQIAHDLATSKKQRSPNPTPPGAGAPGRPTDRHWATRSFDARGGSVVARCQRDRAYLVSWSPSPGWSVEDALRGPAAEASVVFDGDDGAVDDLATHLTVRCVDGRPVRTAVTGTDDAIDHDSGSDVDRTDTGEHQHRDRDRDHDSDNDSDNDEHGGEED